MAKKNTLSSIDQSLLRNQGAQEYFDSDVPTREEILAVMRDQQVGFSFEQLTKHFGLDQEKAQEGLEKRLQAMERDKQIVKDEQGVRKVNPIQDGVSGTVQGHRDGYGFLIADNGSMDIYLSPREMLKVMHGDKVLVRPTSENKNKIEGVIVEVTERRTQHLVGRLLQEQGVYVVVPENQRIKHDIIVGKADLNGAKHGQVVTVTILRQPTRHTQPLGKIVEVLGEIDDPGMEIEIAVRKFNVPVDFSKATIAQAEAIPDEVVEADYQGRVDLRDVNFITIDGEDARDFDDAVYCEEINIGTDKRKKMAWRLLVAIADVSHYVKPGSAIDKDAVERGTSVYFPRRVIPMLPESLSNGLCSLNPNVDRLVMVCDMIIPQTGTKAGMISAYQFYDAVIHSQARTTYTSIWGALQQPTGPDAKAIAHVYPMVQGLYTLYQLLDSKRRERGAMDFETTETKIICNDLGKIDRIVAAVRNDAHKLIEECMLAANTCAAEFIAHHKREALFRVHEGPTPEKLELLREYLRGIGLSLSGGSEPTGKDYAEVLDKARQRPDYPLIQTMCLRSMQQAIYSPDNAGHFGLAYPAYTHFTSPIRRYPDLLVHRVIRSILENRKYKPSLSELPKAKDESEQDHEHAVWERLGLVLSGYERRADEASRDVEAWLKCWFIKEHVGEEFSGRITGVAAFGLFVTLDSLYVEGLVHISELGSEYFQYNESSHELRGERTGQRYRLTDQVHVQVARVDLEARRIEFRLVEGTGYETLMKAARKKEPAPQIKRAAKPKPAALKGQTASQRRAEQRKNAKAGARPPSKKTAGAVVSRAKPAPKRKR